MLVAFPFLYPSSMIFGNRVIIPPKMWGGDGLLSAGELSHFEFPFEYSYEGDEASWREK